MTILEAQQFIHHTLLPIYEQQETSNIVNLVLENLTGRSRIDRLLSKNTLLNDQQLSLVQTYTKELLQHRPIQYVLGQAHFLGLDFFVNEQVLIPRPETEELVTWICETIQNAPQLKTVLDIGTGSGCIPISIKNRIKSSEISAIDVSSNALDIANKNAVKFKTKVQFLNIDILRENQWKDLSKFDIIVSNPPYISNKEKPEMAINVLEYEPHLALFVPDADPLLFYRKIGSFAKEHLNDNGRLFFEINEQYGDEVAALLKELHFDAIEVKKDMQLKNRMVKCLFKK